MAGGPVWMSTEDAARRLGVATKTVYRFIDRGELLAYRIGRVIRLKEADIEAYEASCQIEPGSCLLYTSPSPRDRSLSRMPSSA